MRTIEKQLYAIANLSTSDFLKSKRWNINDSLSVRDLEISLELISNRLRIQTLLREIGLPVPKSRAIYFLEDLATAISQVGGYPIAIKPLNAFNQEGISLNIDDFIEAKAACGLVFQKSKSDGVLVEKDRLGFNYRILVLEGRVVRGIKVISTNFGNAEIAVDCTDKMHPENIYLAQKVAAFVGLNIVEIELICNFISLPISYGSGVIINVNSYSNFNLNKYFI